MKILNLLLILSCAISACGQKHLVVNPYTGEKAKTDNAPSLEIFSPSDSCNGAVVVCPGGGYGFLAYEKEGTDWAEWFAGQNVLTAVLNYRLPHGEHSVPLADAQAAIKYLRENAQLYGISPDKIGVMGFSAGGHLAATAATHYDSDSERPSFQILIYPVISMDKSITHQGSRINLTGEDAPEEILQLYSNELQVAESNPPAYILACEDDDLVPVANSLRYYSALTEKGVPAEMHLYPSGGHGFGRLPSFKYVDSMQRTLGEWLSDVLKSR